MATTAPTFLLAYDLNPLPFASSATKVKYPLTLSSWSLRSFGSKNCPRLMGCPQASISRRGEGTFDPELRSVLELATDSELYELERILFGPSYFSPLLKSITSRADNDYIMIGEDNEERQDFIELLESRFLFLAADARSTLRGWRPSYRDVLLGVRRKLKIPCSSKLSTEDLEAEIFLHLLQDHLSGEDSTIPCSLERVSDGHGSLELGLSKWKVLAISALKVGVKELQSVVFKGGGMFTLAKIYQLLARRLSGKMLLEAANYQIKHEVIRKGGQLAAINLESKAALLAARQAVGNISGRCRYSNAWY
ncbi:PREDICTED: uncharacterized protein LOC104611082 isoform X2 [Nelumbo nucifera]|uniref:Uncharacterized protein LOC104611082 isoform X2 n=1 Tax=Nelumbo nucifera TaxID=4432 RepID=A0A1U8Q9Y0_NELNU|nr:PREDICTED: uncharacterized protein LOC104611082 isoform X2 [Nelumbo nucifera]